jgi:hypothetical protein
VGGGEGGGASVGSRQDDLAGIFFPQISDGEYPVDVGFAFFIRYDIAICIGFGSRRNQLIVGIKTDKYEKSSLG